MWPVPGSRRRTRKQQGISMSNEPKDQSTRTERFLASDWPIFIILLLTVIATSGFIMAIGAALMS